VLFLPVSCGPGLSADTYFHNVFHTPPLLGLFALDLDGATGVTGSDAGESVALEVGLSIGLFMGEGLVDERDGDGVLALELCV
jgi:hypothetical protein